MNWSEHIPLVTLIVAAFGAGGIAQVVRSIPRIHARLDAIEKWQNKETGRREAFAEIERNGRLRIRTQGLGVPIHPDDQTPP